MSLQVMCAECGKTISNGQTGLAQFMGEEPEMLDTLHIVADITGYDGTLSGGHKQVTDNGVYLCGSCLKEKLPKVFRSIEELRK